MKMMKTKVSALFVCASLMVANAAAAATPAESAASTQSVSVETMKTEWTGPKTNVNGIWVPGFYVGFQDSKVVYIPDGTGITLVAKGIPVPKGTIYID
ncbi:hypothetical protein [Paenibacillus silviterrae]|uniref:hypothetical protein n=1 Tax=Paenibacillus silviterrae TaxID=3242194 RepID=UPI002543C042|nr:hypothetical protein [Paenibacillus chinjuensis]